MKNKFNYIFLILNLILLKIISTNFEESILDFEKINLFCPSGEEKNNSENLIYHIDHTIRITKFPFSKNKFVFESDGITYKKAIFNKKNITNSLLYDANVLKKFFLNKDENQISFILNKNKSKSEIFILQTDSIIFLNSENFQDFSKKKFLNKEIIDLNLEKKNISKNIYFINFSEGKVFSTLSPELFSKKNLDFIKKINTDFDSKKLSLLVAFDRENNNILARAFCKKNEDNSYFINNLSLNNSINIGKGIGENLLEAILELNSNIKLYSLNETINFYKKFLHSDKNDNNFKSKGLINKGNYFFTELKI